MSTIFSGESVDGKHCIEVSGFPECPWFRLATCIAHEFAETSPHRENVQISLYPMKRSEFREHLLEVRDRIPLYNHYSCPLVVEGPSCSPKLSSPLILSPSPMQDSPASMHHFEPTAKRGLGVCNLGKIVGGYTQLEKILSDRYNFVAETCGKAPRYAGSC